MEKMKSELSYDEQVVAPPPHGRRRPGRVENASPHLIPLLRQQPVVSIEPDFDGYDDDLRPFRGIMLGLLLSAFLWAFIFFGIQLALR
jgi:hypothetical protein